MVGDVGFEPTTPSVSRKCSPPELIARTLPPASAARGIVPTPPPPRHPHIARAECVQPRLAREGGLRYPTPCALAHADVAQLVEHNLAKVGVAGSNPVVRSIDDPTRAGTGILPGPAFDLDKPRFGGHPYGDVAKWQGRGLQSLHPRFESGRRLQRIRTRARQRFRWRARRVFSPGSENSRMIGARGAVRAMKLSRTGSALLGSDHALKPDGLLELHESPVQIVGVVDVLDGPRDDALGYERIALARLLERHDALFRLRLRLRRVLRLLVWCTGTLE